MARDKEDRVNPSFRGRETEFDGGEMTVKSPVGSVFGDYAHKGLNAMDTALEEQAPAIAKRNTSGKGAKA